MLALAVLHERISTQNVRKWVRLCRSGCALFKKLYVLVCVSVCVCELCMYMLKRSIVTLKTRPENPGFKLLVAKLSASNRRLEPPRGAGLGLCIRPHIHTYTGPL